MLPKCDYVNAQMNLDNYRGTYTQRRYNNVSPTRHLPQIQGRAVTYGW